MARKLDDLIIGLQLRTKALEEGLNNVKKRLDKHSRDVRNAGKGYTELALAAGVAFNKIVDAIKGGIDTFNEYRAAAIGLQSIVEGTGNSFFRAQKFIEEYTQDGLIAAADAATALKNLLARGYTQTQAEEVLARLKDAAAFGRQSALSLGEAVRSATEGLKNENSVLVDNAGVTKNVSQMWKEYAETLGKSVDDLTMAEKIQAEYNGIMKETQHQVGDAAKLAAEFAGAQSRSAKAVKDLSAAFGESLVPALRPLLDLFARVVTGITNLIKSVPGLSAAVITAVAVFLSLVTAFTSVSAALKVLTPAITALKIAFSGLLAHPVVLAFTAIAGAAAYVAVEVNKARKAQEEFNAAIEKYNRIRREGIGQTEIEQIREEAEKLRQLIETYEKLWAEFEKVRSTTARPDLPYLDLEQAAENLGISIDELAKGFEKFGIEIDLVNGDIEEAKRLFKDLARAIDEANIKTGEQYLEMAREVSQKNANIQATKELIAIYKSAARGSAEWLDAEKRLAEQFPQFATAAGIKIDAIEKVTDAQDKAVKAQWNMLTAELQMTRIKIQSLMAEKEALLAAAEAERSALMGPGDVRHYARTGMPEAIRQKVEETNKAIQANKNAVDELKTTLEIIDELLSAGIEGVPGVMPIRNTKLKAYENEALETALRIHNHRVAMDELTKEQEIASLEEILRKYARTAEEKMDLEERIYRAKKELRERELADIERSIEEEARKLAERTDQSERWIQRQKSLGNLTEMDEIAAYNRVIKYHKEHLEKIKADTRISADEKKRIIEEETRYIQDQQDKILAIQRSAAERAVNAYIDAKRRQYETERKLEEERLYEQLRALDKEYDEKLRRIEAENREADLQSLYEQERRYANAATREGQERLKEIRRRIADLEAEAERERLLAEKEARREAIEREIEATQDRYRKLTEELESEKEEMLAAAQDYAKEAVKILSDSQVEIASEMAKIIQQFDTDSQNLIKKGLDKLRQLVQGYKTVMEEITFTPGISLAGAGAGAGTAIGANNINVTVNDYGDKNITSKDELVDYAKELFDVAASAARIWGGLIR